MKNVLPLYKPLPTPDEMAQWDETAHALFGMPPFLLMENAAHAALRELECHVSLTESTNILILMGKGNNGGDGAALARMLHDRGCNVLVCPCAPLTNLSSATAQHLDIADKVGVNFLPVGAKGLSVLPIEWRSPHVVVDALTGTGLKGELRPKTLSFIRSINSYRDSSFIFSLDCPSGLCGYSGKPKPEAVRAHVTVCFEAGKPGLFFPEAAPYTGKVSVRRVGIPIAVRSTVLPSWELLNPQKGGWATPSDFHHKGKAGKILIVGGSEGMAGAPVLSALGALRAGAGLVHLAMPAALENAARAGRPEILSHSLGKSPSWQASDAGEVVKLIAKTDPGAVLLGPGMGRGKGTRAILEKLLSLKERPPLILDADALFFFRLPGASSDSLPLSLLRENDILTPHPGEMAAMLPDSFFPNGVEYTGKEPDTAARIQALQENRPSGLAAFTRACRAILVLKGPGTLIGRQDSPVVLCPTATSSLAVGGSGDVLSGAITALAASPISTFDAACLGVYLHARAGELLAVQSPRGHMAGEIADAFLRVWEELCA